MALVAVALAGLEPSPQFHVRVFSIEPPSGSVEVAVKVTPCPSFGVAGVKVKPALGGVSTRCVRLYVSDSPSASVTVTFTV